ncbi:alpha/beta fold hydrolase [Streptomyces sp. NPDC050315]|uniref:alpha/beta fold hydrolase n=1 Tax=Streptomyces sp. NPDC050315 TaxID=3155039 RepID=UPI003437D914
MAVDTSDARPARDSGVTGLRRSVAEGPPLTTKLWDTLPAVLRRAAAASSPQELVYVLGDGAVDRQSYAELAVDASRVLGGLRAAGVRCGDRVVLQLADNRDFVSGLWACLLGGFVAAPLAAAPSAGAVGGQRTGANGGGERLAAARLLLDDPWVLGGRTVTQASTRVPTQASAADRPVPNGARALSIDELHEAEPDADWHTGGPDDLALLMLTSGSTGTPKAVRLSHRNVLMHAAAGQQHHGQTERDVWFNWMPLDHVGGVVMSHLRNVAVGCRQVHASTPWVLADPLRWPALLHEHRATLTWAPNFAYGLVNERAADITGQDWDLSALRIVLNGGETVVGRTARRFVELLAPYGLPADAIRPVWGMSETASAQIDTVLPPTTTFDDDGSRGTEAVEVGRPYPGFAVRIVDEAQQVVPEGTTGRIQVRGAAVTAGYHRAPERTREAFTGDGWLETGDLGVLRSGALTITGRAKDVIIVNGVNHLCHEVEAVVEELGCVERSFTAACAVRPEGATTDELALFFPLKPDADPEKAPALIRAAVLRETGLSPSHLVPVAREQIPKTELGKIQRSRLREQFEAGAFAGRHDGASPARLHRLVWRRAPLPERARRDAPGGHTVLLADRHGLAERLADRLRARDQRCTLTHPGAEFAALGPDRYALPFDDPAACTQLLALLAERGEDVTAVVHLATWAPYGGEPTPDDLARAERDAVRSPTRLAAALTARYGEADPPALYVVSSYSQSVHPEDAVAFERAPAATVIRSLRQELPRLRCRHIDLPADDADAAAGLVLDELDAAAEDTEVAFRGGDRYTRSLVAAPVPAAGSGPATGSRPPLRPGGLYAISGGLGAIAVEVARHLLTTYGVRLLLLGRTRLPDRGEWPTRIAAGGELGRRLGALKELSALGEVDYRAADVCDARQLRAAVAAAEQRWDTELAGVLHLAGHYADTPADEASAERWEAVLRAKTHGAWALHQLLRGRPGAVFVSFSSTVGAFGSSRMHAYSAANSFLDALAVHQRTRCGMAAWSLGWSMWDEIGMSRGHPYRALTAARGHRAIGVPEALRCLDAALAQDTPHLLIGLDAERMARAGLVAGPPPLPRARQLPAEEQLSARPPAGHPGGLAAAGTPDRVERVLRGIWCEILHRDHVGPHDNFFELGGQSLQATRMLGQVRAALGTELTFDALYADPTIAGLALRLRHDAHHPDSGPHRDPAGVLLPLRPGGRLPPLFCVHPATGVGWPYAALLSGSAPDRPLYALQARGLAGSEPMATTVEEMAADYVHAVRTVQPRGPYHLLGWSFGGLVAHEMAVQLQAAGEETGLLAMLDTWPPGPGATRPAPEQLERMLMEVLLKDAGLQHALPASEYEHLDWPGIVRSLGHHPNSSLTALGAEGVSALVGVMRNNAALERSFTPHSYSGDLIHFTATDRLFGTASPQDAWRPYVAGRVVIHPVDCHHVDMLRPQHLTRIVHVLDETMRTADRTTGSEVRAV